MHDFSCSPPHDAGRPELPALGGKEVGVSLKMTEAIKTYELVPIRVPINCDKRTECVHGVRSLVEATADGGSVGEMKAIHTHTHTYVRFGTLCHSADY